MDHQEQAFGSPAKRNGGEGEKELDIWDLSNTNTRLAQTGLIDIDSFAENGDEEKDDLSLNLSDPVDLSQKKTKVKQPKRKRACKRSSKRKQKEEEEEEEEEEEDEYGSAAETLGHLALGSSGDLKRVLTSTPQQYAASQQQAQTAVLSQDTEVALSILRKAMQGPHVPLDDVDTIRLGRLQPNGPEAIGIKRVLQYIRGGSDLSFATQGEVRSIIPPPAKQDFSIKIKGGLLQRPAAMPVAMPQAIPRSAPRPFSGSVSSSSDFMNRMLGGTRPTAQAMPSAMPVSMSDMKQAAAAQAEKLFQEHKDNPTFIQLLSNPDLVKAVEQTMDSEKAQQQQLFQGAILPPALKELIAKASQEVNSHVSSSSSSLSSSSSSSSTTTSPWNAGEHSVALRIGDGQVALDAIRRGAAGALGNLLGTMGAQGKPVPQLAQPMMKSPLTGRQIASAPGEARRAFMCLIQPGSTLATTLARIADAYLAENKPKYQWHNILSTHCNNLTTNKNTRLDLPYTTDEEFEQQAKTPGLIIWYNPDVHKGRWFIRDNRE